MRHLFKKYRGHIWTYIIFASTVMLLAIGFVFFQSKQAGFIYPNTYISDINFGGKTEEEAKKILNEKIQSILNSGAVININGGEVRFELYEYAADPDLSRDLIKFNAAETAARLYAVGRNRLNLITNLRASVNAIFSRNNLPVEVDFADDDLVAYLREKLKNFEVPAKNASLSFSGERATIADEITGQKINYTKLLKELKIQLQNLQNPYIGAEIVPDEPEIKKYEVEDRLAETELALSRAPFFIKYGDTSWSIDRAALKKYLDFEKRGGVAGIAISKEESAEFFEKVSSAIDMPAQNARFEIKNGKVAGFQTSRLGLQVDTEATREALNGILLDGFPAITAIVKDSQPEITTSNANNLGVSALLGVGTSDFAGSPPNRIHNIKTGADKINGILIKPGEEFSLLKAIGPVDGENGFKQELVIKEDRTTPEFGGGLCQIGTTVFRAALASGLPIIERRNHSYRVVYYEPAGTDATIYNPSPDLKFKNDTPGYILIQTKISGNELSFEFWGTNDGREATHTNSVIYNITDPPPPKYIETAELPAGTKKKLETAHKGADAYFKYTVKYPDERGEVSQTFYSHYRPWAEVWLVGLPAGQAGASSTPIQTAN